MPSSRPPNGSLVDGEPISPELALVSPELGKRARALLREQPWELPTAPRARPPRPAATAEDERIAPAAPVPRSPRRRSRLAPAIWLGAGIVIFTAGLAIGMERPNDTPILVQEPGQTASDPREPRATSTAAVLGTQTATTAPTTPARPRDRRGSGAPVEIRPISAGYVWERGSFLATGAVTRVERFELATGCRTSLVVPPMTVGADASFRFRGRLRSTRGGRYAVEVTGRWVSGDVVRGDVSFSSKACPQRSLAFLARPSCQPLEKCSKRADAGAVRP